MTDRNIKSLRLIIFDLDGTIVNSYPAIIESLNFTMRRLGLKEGSDYAIKRAVGWGDKALVAPFVRKDKLAKALAIYRNHHRKSLLRNVSFMPHAKKLLDHLSRKGYKLAIATNRPAKFTHILLRSIKIEKYFDYILCKDQIKFGKPHPSILNKIIRRFKISKQKVIYVGDMAIDICTGKRARVKTFAVCTGSSSMEELKKEGPTYIARNLKKIFQIL